MWDRRFGLSTLFVNSTYHIAYYRSLVYYIFQKITQSSFLLLGCSRNEDGEGIGAWAFSQTPENAKT